MHKLALSSQKIPFIQVGVKNATNLLMFGTYMGWYIPEVRY